MPYKLKKYATGYKVVDVKGHSYSKKPIPKTRAIKQLYALSIHSK